MDRELPVNRFPQWFYNLPERTRYQLLAGPMAGPVRQFPEGNLFLDPFQMTRQACVAGNL
jgi:hypothetical protein